MSITSTITIELDDRLRKLAEGQAAHSGCQDANAYYRSLLAGAIEAAEIDRKLQEAEEEIDRGEYSIWKPGDVAAQVRALIQKHRDSTCSK